MKRWKIVLPTLLATSGLPLVSLVGCGDPVETYSISGGNTKLNGQAGQPYGDELTWQVTNSKQEPVAANLTIDGIYPSSDFPNWIQINDGRVEWSNEAVGGTYRFKVKAEIEGVQQPVYSGEITLVIAETYSISGGHTKLDGYVGSPGGDGDKWEVKNSKQETVTADLTIDGIELSDSFPEWITIENGKVKWSNEAAKGTYKFRIKAVIDETNIIYSKEITLNIAEHVYTISGGAESLNGDEGQQAWDNSAWKVKNSLGQTVSANLSIVGIDPSESFPEWIVIDKGKVKWTNSAVKGTYKFEVKAEIEGVQQPIYSNEITLAIAEKPASKADFKWIFNDDNYTTYFYDYLGSGGKVVIPSSVVDDGNTYKVVGIGGEGFLSCASLTSVIIPNTITKIDTGVFGICTSLTSVTIGEGVTNIGDEAFTSCYNLTDSSGPDGSCGFTFRGTVEQWKKVKRGYNWHSNVGATKIQCSDWQCGLDEQPSDFNFSFEDDNTAILTGYIGKGGKVIIPSSIWNEGKIYTVVAIDKRAFEDQTSITSVTIPSNITIIGEMAFHGCKNLTSVILEEGIESIGLDAFYGCSMLEAITIPSSVTDIGRYAFCECSSLKSVTIAEDITITSNIASCAFSKCSSLTSVTIPRNIKSIGEMAFYQCSNLTNESGPDGAHGFNFLGTVNEWKAVTRGENWHDSCPATEIQCSDKVCSLDYANLTYLYLVNKEY